MLSNDLEIAQQHYLNYSFNRTPKQARIEELMNHICEIENSIREKDSSKAHRSSPATKECSKRTKKVAIKIPSNRSSSRAQVNLSSSLASEEDVSRAQINPSSPSVPAEIDDDNTPLIIKRKRPSIEQSSAAPRLVQKPSNPSAASPNIPTPISMPLSGGPNPSPDPEDHLTLKKLKASHSHESKSQTQIPVQTSTPTQTTVNIPPILSQPTIPPVNPTPLFEVVHIEESDEEQDLQSLQTNIFNEISSPPNQTTTRLTLAEAELPIESTAEQPITLTADVQAEPIAAEHTTVMVPEQPLAEQIPE